jgi:hypothetical protein
LKKTKILAGFSFKHWQLLAAIRQQSVRIETVTKNSGGRKNIYPYLVLEIIDL